jgi:hypothetical protein
MRSEQSAGGILHDRYDIPTPMNPGRALKDIANTLPVAQAQLLSQRWRYNHRMYHYDPNTALEELTEDATLPNPVHVRDMILRKKLTADKSLELNRLFVEYQKFFGETQKLGKEILKQLTS